LISIGNMSLSSTRGSVGASTSPIQVTVGDTLTASAGKGTVTITSSDSITIGTSSTGKGAFSVQSGGSITATGNISAAPLSLVTTSNGDVTIADNVTIGKAKGTITLLAGGAGSIVRGGTNSRIIGSTVIASSGTGDIDIQTAATNVTATTGGSGNVTVSNTASKLTLGASAAGNQFELINSGTITTTAIDAEDISITSMGTLTINGNVSAGSSAAFDAQGTGKISAGSTGVIAAPSIELSSGTGGIATSKLPLKTAASSLSVHTAGTGSAFIANTGSLTLSGSAVGGSLQVSSSGDLTVGDVATSNGSLLLQAGSGLLVEPGATVSATNGNITLNSANPNTGSITIGAGANITASSATSKFGHVFIAVGIIPPVKINPSPPAPPPSNVTINSSGLGKVFLGTNGFTANDPTNTLNALNREIVFSTGTLGPEAITLDGDVTITAELVPIAYRPGVPITDPAPSTLPDDMLPALSDIAVTGDFLLHPRSTTVLHVLGSRIEIGRGSVVYLSKSPSVVAVYNLHDSRHASVTFSNGHHRFSIAPGEVAIFSTRPAQFAEVGALNDMTYRDVRPLVCPEGTSLYTAEFSLVTAMSRLGALHRLCSSSNPENSRLAGSIIKTAAIIHSLRASAGVYRRVQHPAH
jgi:hypothetical protein